MRQRLALVAALGVVSLAAPAAVAGTAAPVLDGKKVKKISMTAHGGLQDNDADAASIDSPDRADCAAPRCAKLVFTYKPAKGVKGDALFTVAWTNPASDIDLYVAAVNKDGSTSEVSSAIRCGGVGGTSEKVFVPAGSLTKGKKYALVADFFRSINEDITGTVEMPKGDFSRPVPSQAEAVYPVNCEMP